MTQHTSKHDSSWPTRLLAFVDNHPSLWLLLGAGLLAASQMRFGIGALAWLAPVPWLRHLRLTEGWRARTLLVSASLVAWTLAVAKILTAPMPLVLALAFSVPIGLALTLPLLAVPLLRRRLGEGAAVLAFAALMVLGEWTLHVALPFGTWGAAAHTQLDHLALLQLASVTGVHGVSFFVYLVAASLEVALHRPSPRRRKGLALVVTSLLVVVAAGEARLAFAEAGSEPVSRVAAIGTDSTIGVGPLPTDTQNAEVERALLERTRAAARSGAAMVVWTEGALLVWPDDEPAFQAQIAALSGELEVTVVAAYIVPTSLEPLHYRNRYVLTTPEGRVDHVYDKHRPVPGEPADPGTQPMPLYDRPELGRVSGAICYDYDFPRLGLAHAALDVDLVALPSSDWLGIHPLHTQMAGVRAIEGGHSVLRSTRFGLSAGIDPYGRVRGQQSHWDEGERVLVVSLPRRGVSTVYGALGDWFPLTCAVLGLLLLLVASVRRTRWYAASPWRNAQSSRSPAAPSSTRASDSGWTPTSS